MKVLVLSGGGSKGAYQVGALKKWIVDDGIEYDAFCGISVGSLNSAYLAQFPAGDPQGAWEKLKEVWDRVGPTNVKKGWWPFGQLSSLWKSSVYNSEPLQKWVRSELNPNAIAQSGKVLRVVSVSWNTAKTHVAKESDPEIVSRVIASSSFPVMFIPAEIDGEQWTDGGLRSVTPLGEAIRLGADDIDVIMCSNPELFSPFDPNSAAIPARLERSLDIILAQIEISDLKICGYKNDLAELKPKYRKVKVRLLQPSESLPGDSLSFDQETIQLKMQRGYADACKLGND
jgi:NTE family protein